MDIKPRYFYVPLLAGVTTPPLVQSVLISIFGPRRSVDLVDPFVIVSSLIPFVVLIGFMVLVARAKVRRPRQEFIFWGGLVATCGFTLYAHFDIWKPIYKGGRMPSTFAIVFIFIPLYALGFLALGVLIGWGMSFLARQRS